MTMSDRAFSLGYGKGQMAFAIPDAHLLYELVGRNRRPPVDLSAAYRHALQHPIDSPPLTEIVKPGETVAITVSDITRGWQRNHLTLPLLIDCLNEAGVSDEDITVIIAVGAHRQNTRDEVVDLCSPRSLPPGRVVNHNAWDTANMVFFGKTSRGTEVAVSRIAVEADRLILYRRGHLPLHGRLRGRAKSVMPGIASLNTIQQCHMWAMADDRERAPTLAANMKTRGNPAHEDMMEVAAFIKPDFIVNVVPNLDGDITGIFAGNWVSAWWEATRMVDGIFGVSIGDRADIVIASTGGYPKDINLYQTQKTIDNAVYAMKPGGAAIILAECPDIMEPREFFDWFNHPSAAGFGTCGKRPFSHLGLGRCAPASSTATRAPLSSSRSEQNIEVAGRPASCRSPPSSGLTDCL